MYEYMWYKYRYTKLNKNKILQPAFIFFQLILLLLFITENDFVV